MDAFYFSRERVLNISQPAQDEYQDKREGRNLHPGPTLDILLALVWPCRLRLLISWLVCQFFHLGSTVSISLVHIVHL